MSGFRLIQFDGLPGGLARPAGQAFEDGALEFETSFRLDEGTLLHSAKDGEFVVAVSRQSPPGAPAYTWAILRTPEAVAAEQAQKEAKRAALTQAANTETESDASASGAAGADGAEGESSPRHARGRRRNPPPAETVSDDQEQPSETSPP